MFIFVFDLCFLLDIIQVILDGCKSSIVPVSCGVPQSTALGHGPLLLCYVNCILNCVSNYRLAGYFP